MHTFFLEFLNYVRNNNDRHLYFMTYNPYEPDIKVVYALYLFILILSSDYRIYLRKKQFKSNSLFESAIVLNNGSAYLFWWKEENVVCIDHITDQYIRMTKYVQLAEMRTVFVDTCPLTLSF